MMAPGAAAGAVSVDVEAGLLDVEDRLRAVDHVARVRALGAGVVERGALRLEDALTQRTLHGVRAVVVRADDLLGEPQPDAAREAARVLVVGQVEARCGSSSNVGTPGT